MKKPKNPKTFDIITPGNTSHSNTITLNINRCNVTLNFSTDSDKSTIKAVKSIMLSNYYQCVPADSEKAEKI